MLTSESASSSELVLWFPRTKITTQVTHNISILDSLCLSNTEFICATSDYKIRAYHIDGKPMGLFAGHSDRISQLYHVEGAANVFYSTGEDGLMMTWDIRVQKAAQKIIAGSPLYSIGYCPDLNLLATGSESKILLWDLTGNKKGTYQDIHTGEVNGVIFHPTTKALYSCGLDGLISEFDCSLGTTEDDTYVSGMNLEQPLSKFGFYGTDSNNFYAITTNETLCLGKLEEDKFKTFPINFRQQLGEMGDTNISLLIDCKYLKRSDQLLLFTSSLSGRVDIFDINEFDVTLIARLPEKSHTDVVRTISLTPNKDLYITGGDDGVLCIWNKTPVNNTKDQLKIVRPKVHCKNFSPY